MSIPSSPSERDDDVAARGRYDVLVLPVLIDAPDESIARIEFIQALAEDMSLIQVRPAHEDIDVEGNDAIGI